MSYVAHGKPGQKLCDSYCNSDPSIMYATATPAKVQTLNRASHACTVCCAAALAAWNANCGAVSGNVSFRCESLLNPGIREYTGVDSSVFNTTFKQEEPMHSHVPAFLLRPRPLPSRTGLARGRGCPPRFATAPAANARSTSADKMSTVVAIACGSMPY